MIFGGCLKLHILGTSSFFVARFLLVLWVHCVKENQLFFLSGLCRELFLKNCTGVNTLGSIFVCVLRPSSPSASSPHPQGVGGAEEKPSFLEAYLSCSLPSPKNSPTVASGHTDINIISHLLCILCTLYAHNINVYDSSAGLQKCYTAPSSGFDGAKVGVVF